MVPAFLNSGWHVIATMRRAEERQSIFAEEKQRYGDRLKILSLDVTSRTDRDHAKQAITGLDCLIHNAGYGLAGPMEETPEADLRQEMETNFTAPALLTQLFLPLLRHSQGRIIFVSSSLGFTGFPLYSLYCASKFAMEGFAESLTYELAPQGVQVALVEPGAHRTQFGSHLIWNDKGTSSPYASQIAGFKQLREQIMARPGTTLENVVRKVISLAQARRMPLRVRAGGDAQALYAMKKLTPAWLMKRVLQMYFDRVAKRGSH
jgi:NAD(P)-dependent dehydrogenase (short-subunit alcohol dehydrogenase family)